MFTAYVVVTILTAAANGSAAVANFIGHDYVKAQAHKLRVPPAWRLVLGSLLATGALGLLAGFLAPALGTVSAGGLVLYFLGALGAHMRVRDLQLGPWVAYVCLAAAALVLNLSHHEEVW